MEAVINFRIPSLELGAYVKTTLNISTALSGYVDYDAKTNTFITDMEAPETAKEVMTFQKGAYHYLKCDKCDRQPISKKISVDKVSVHLIMVKYFKILSLCMIKLDHV